MPLDVACLGASARMTLSGGLPFADVLVDGKPGAFLVDFATTGSAIDLAAFDTPPTATGCDPSKLGAACSFASFDLLGAWGRVTLFTSRLFAPDDTVREAGVLGTDLARMSALTLDYAGARIFRAGEGALCDDAKLLAGGFVPLSAKGFFARDASSLALFSSVAASSTGSATVPNVPTVPVRIGGVSALAQLDTGFSDKVLPFSINVNEAMLAAIQAKDPALLVRDASRDQSLTTCAGVAEAVDAYRLAPAASVELVTESGAAARAWSQAVLFVKHTPSAAIRCGGIGTWSVPAAQMAASFFIDTKTMIFDPFTSRVWVKSR
jgi:hypothetical protein